MKRGIPVDTLPLIISSISEGTLKQYTGCYKKYWNFCRINDMEPLDYSLDKYLTFLTEEFRAGLSYSVLNSYRSALNLIFNPINENDGKVIARLLKGVYNTKPSMPKYAAIWNPEPVLRFLETWYPLESLSLENLTHKLVTLMALVSASRVQTLSKIRRDNILRQSEGIEIRIVDCIKTSGPNRLQPLLVFPYFRQKPELCVASTIDFYMEKTRQFARQQDSLILTHKKPFNAATSQTISRWIKNTLRLGGIDTSKFSSHSVRHASTSSALRAGVNIEIIKRTAGWSPGSSTFFKFYNRPLCQSGDTFARSIINIVDN